MNLLWLGPRNEKIEAFLQRQPDAVVFWEEELTMDAPVLFQKDFVISFGYRHLLPAPIVQGFAERAINIHISYLPWNRGADPNLWSFLENTPKGVTIHRLTETLDAGPILCQEKVDLSSEETLKSSYDILMHAASDLFRLHWPEIKTGAIKAVPQAGGGSYHRKKDVEPYRHLLRSGWDTPVKDLAGKALCAKGSC